MNKTQRGRAGSFSRLLGIFWALCSGCLAIALILPIRSVSAADPSEGPYTIMDLGPFGAGSRESIASGINNSGQVVGYNYFGAAFLYQNGQMIDLGGLGGTPDTHPADINDRGQVVGTASTPDGTGHAFLYQDGHMTDLGTLGGAWSSASGINNSGQVVGTSYIPGNGAFHAFLYTPDSGMQDIGTLPGFTGSQATGINNSGQVVGAAYTSDGTGHVFLYQDGHMTDLGTLGGTSSSAWGINDSGQVVGTHFVPGSADQGNCCILAFLYTPGGGIQDLGIPGGLLGGGILAHGLNNRGQVVGETHNGPWFYSAGTGIFNLMTPQILASGWSYQECFATAINDQAQVVGGCRIGPQGTPPQHAFLMTPTFPKTGVLDSFDRSNAKLAREWSGDAGANSFKVTKSDQVAVHHGGEIYWQPASFGLDQEVFVTLTKVDPNSTRQGVVLKAQGRSPNAEPDYKDGVIQATYDATQETLNVSTFVPGSKNWTSYGPISVKLRDGDQLGARFYATTGQVRIYQNHLPAGPLVTLNPLDQAFFNQRAGRIGLTFEESADSATFDDFGGGSIQ